jgi:Leucine-rich repeat (LRR) protein
MHHLAGAVTDTTLCLQVLWLADNYVSSLTGIEQLGDLQELNVARNDITQIGTSLLPSSRLTSLNLADNQISSLQVRLPASMLSWRVAS